MLILDAFTISSTLTASDYACVVRKANKLTGFYTIAPFDLTASVLQQV